jgi:hypothetical protein
MWAVRGSVGGGVADAGFLAALRLEPDVHNLAVMWMTMPCPEAFPLLVSVTADTLNSVVVPPGRAGSVREGAAGRAQSGGCPRGRGHRAGAACSGRGVRGAVGPCQGRSACPGRAWSVQGRAGRVQGGAGCGVPREKGCAREVRGSVWGRARRARRWGSARGAAGACPARGACPGGACPPGPSNASMYQTCRGPHGLRSSLRTSRSPHGARLFAEVTGYGGSP